MSSLLDRWKRAGRFAADDLKQAKVLVGLAVWLTLLAGGSVAFLRAKLPDLGASWAWGIVLTFWLLALLAFLAVEYARAGEEGGQATAHDKKLFLEVLEVLPSDSEAMWLLCESSFAIRFENDWLRPIDRFAREFTMPERAFHDVSVEEKKIALIDAYRDFHSLLWPNVFVDSRPDDSRLGTKYALEYMELHGAGIDEADNAWDLVGKLDALARRVCDAHRDFIALAAARIGR
ncbi:MAG: hypothetical protein P1T08_13205 [Acidimicrobiia bacterium]|nr:hypothetical protein [Acidimicrobiia bacterium]